MNTFSFPLRIELVLNFASKVYGSVPEEVSTTDHNSIYDLFIALKGVFCLLEFTKHLREQFQS
ncbi:hypothetical protein V2J09_022788 [Rumex salicifolius]